MAAGDVIVLLETADVPDATPAASTPPVEMRPPTAPAPEPVARKANTTAHGRRPSYGGARSAFAAARAAGPRHREAHGFSSRRTVVHRSPRSRPSNLDWLPPAQPCVDLPARLGSTSTG